METLKALIIDDDPVWQGILSRALGRLGMTYKITATEDEAILILSLAGQTLRLVTTDQNLTKDRDIRHGDRLVPVIRQKSPQAFVVGINGNVDSVKGVDLNINKGQWSRDFFHTQVSKWLRL